jgi:hypothetical protein
MDLILMFLAGMIVMDVMWAWRLGIPQTMWVLWKLKRAIKKEMSNGN